MSNFQVSTLVHATANRCGNGALGVGNLIPKNTGIWFVGPEWSSARVKGLLVLKRAAMIINALYVLRGIPPNGLNADFFARAYG